MCVCIYVTKCINKPTHKYREQAMVINGEKEGRSKIGVWD